MYVNDTKTGCPTLLDSIFPCPEKPECGDSGLEALSKAFGGDVWPGCRGKLTERKKDINLRAGK